MSIARRITISVLLVSGLFTLLGTALQLFLDYQRDVQFLEATLTLVEKSHLNSLTQDVWNLDDANMEAQLTDIMNLPDVVYLQLQLPNQFTITKGQLPEPHLMVSKVFEMSFDAQPIANAIPIGTLTVAVTLENIFHNLQDKLVVILLTQTVKIMAVSVFIIFLFYMLVARHLEKISSFIANTSVTSLTTPLVLEKGHGPFRRKYDNDELGVLVASINSMRSDLAIGLEIQYSAQQALQQEVKERREAEKNLQTTLNSIGDAVIATDTKGVITHINPVAAELTGWSLYEAEGKTLAEVYHTVNAETGVRTVTPLMPGNGSKELASSTQRIALISRTGQEYLIADSAAPIRDNEDKVTGMVLVFRDMTEEYAVRAALEESEERQRDLLNNTPSVIYIKDPLGRYLFVNRMYEKLFHITDQEIKGKTDHDVFPMELANVFYAHDQKTIAMDQVFECEEVAQHEDGEHTYLSVKFPLKRASGKVYAICSISTDFTQRKRAEEELHHLRNYLSNIIDSMPSILIGVDPNGIVTQWNSEAVQETGVSVHEAVGQSLAKAFPRLSQEMQRVRKAIQTRQEQIDPKRAHQQGNEVFYEDVTIYPLIANGIEGAVIRLDDVTEQVRLEEMMVQSEKMLSVGGLAAGMAHEINNPLAGMMQTADVLKNRLTRIDLPANQKAAEAAGTTMSAIQTFMEDRGILRMATAIKDSGLRVVAIVDNMLSFARKSEMAFSSHELAELLDKTVELAATDYDLKKQYDFKTIQLVREYADGVPPVPCEGSKIQQVILNILRNGAQAMQDDHVTTPTFILRTRFEPEKAVVVIEIEDNGPGMEEATRKRVFEPFFTTKTVGEGTGLGLSVSYFIITESHRGELSVESEPGKGAKFIIRLPV